MQTKTKKKGFTLVELVVVVAVIAVLSAILIPTIGCFVEEAKETNDMTTVKTLNTVLVRNEAENGKPSSFSEVLDIVSENGYRLEKLTPLSTGHILWDSKNNRFLLKDKDGKDVYRDNTTVAADNVDLWKIVTPETGLSPDYSNYLVDGDYSGLVDDSGVLVFSTGFDIGDNTNITNVKYAHTGDEQTVSIYTNSYNVDLTVDAANDNVHHYDELGNLLIENVKGESYHEHGKVKSVRIKNGHFIAEPGCELGSDVVIDGGSADLGNVVIWKEPEYVLSDDCLTCTATRTSKDGTKTETETVNVAIERIDSTTTTEGSVTYTATFKNPAFGTWSKTEVLPKDLSKEETLVNSMNEAVSGYTGESIMKALVYMANKETNVSVSNLVHSDSTKTFAYDSVNHKFYIVNAADGTVLYPENVTADNANLVYVVNDNNTISTNMTKIYFNDFSHSDYAIKQSNVVASKKYLKHAEIGGNIKYIYTELTSSAKKTDGTKSIEEQASLLPGSFDSTKACFRNFELLEKIFVGENVKYIGKYAFYGCKKLSYVYYNSATENMVYLYDDPMAARSDTPFENTGSSNIQLVFGKDVKVIPCLFGSDSIDGKVVGSVIFEDGIKYTQIGYYAFKGMVCLSEINLPSSCLVIQGSSATSAFAETSLSKIIWNGNNITVGDVLYNSKNNLGHGSAEDLIRFLKGSISRITGDNNSRSLIVGDYTYIAGECTAYNGIVEVYKNNELQYTATLTDGVWTKN